MYKNARFGQLDECINQKYLIQRMTMFKVTPLVYLMTQKLSGQVDSSPGRPVLPQQVRHTDIFIVFHLCFVSGLTSQSEPEV